MMKHYIGLLLILLGVSCKKHYTHSVANECLTDTITVEYINLENQDTSSIELLPISIKKIYDSNGSNGNNDWASDYKIKINHIVNTAGDSINFNPNDQFVWSYGSNDQSYSYTLKINEASFQ